MLIRVFFKAFTRRGVEIRFVEVSDSKFRALVVHGLEILLNSDDFGPHEIQNLSVGEVAGLGAGCLSSVCDLEGFGTPGNRGKA